MESDPIQITLHDYSLQSAYEGELVQVKYGNRPVASFEKDHPERFVTFDSGTSMIWLTTDLFLALHAQVCLELFQMRITSVCSLKKVKHNLLERFVSSQQECDTRSPSKEISYLTVFGDSMAVELTLKVKDM